MATLVNAPSRKIRLTRNERENCWEGSTGCYPLSLDPQALIRIAYAGPWAQIKYEARARLGHDATFDPADEPAALLRHLQDPHGNEYQVTAEPCVRVRAANGLHSFKIDLNALSYDVSYAYQIADKHAPGNVRLLKDLLHDTRDQMDQPDVWLAVETVAKALLCRVGSQRPGTLPADEAETLIYGMLASPQRLPGFRSIYRELLGSWELLPRMHVLGFLRPLLVLPLAVIAWLESRFLR
jgi:hypothetical protein